MKTKMVNIGNGRTAIITKSPNGKILAEYKSNKIFTMGAGKTEEKAIERLNKLIKIAEEALIEKKNMPL